MSVNRKIRWITPEEISQYEFCPADKEILDRTISISVKLQKKSRLSESRLFQFMVNFLTVFGQNR